MATTVTSDITQQHLDFLRRLSMGGNSYGRSQLKHSRCLSARRLSFSDEADTQRCMSLEATSLDEAWSIVYTVYHMCKKTGDHFPGRNLWRKLRTRNARAQLTLLLEENQAKGNGGARVTVLDLGTKVPQPGSVEHFGEQVGAALESKSMEGLRTLRLDDRRIDDHNMIAVTRHFGSIRHLTRLHLAGNNMTDESASVLAQRLGLLNELEVLGLAHNQIGPEGCAAIAQQLTSMRSLERLNLCHNHIGDEGAIAISQHLGALPHLWALQLAGNDIGPDGATQVLHHVQFPLQMLDLSHNQLGDLGAAAIAEHLGSMTSVCSFNLADNGITDASCILNVLPSTPWLHS
eukprot:CAMPEP_0182472556 /NCGR_PEP_ID=MMETSP1319-20130603/22335_1 /TAXON_ID=172717 /ORGANISM="Bolidomonas pacifica, Strain RCC208" /LENGTH=346 /DNA_ID=CAMNT_0024673249 /DNA_START=46 /DNA_END=1082 /DNA_ORIENTATION=+